MKIVELAVDSIMPYRNNTKKHDAVQIANVATSIEKYGFVQPIVIDKNGVIIIGHCRYEASKSLGFKTVPCVKLDTLTEEQVNALRIIDNKTNESEWDLKLLEQELEDLDMEFSDFDFDFDFGDGLKDSDTDDDDGDDFDDDEDGDEFAHSCPRCGYQWDD